MNVNISLRAISKLHVKQAGIFLINGRVSQILEFLSNSKGARKFI